MKRAIVVHGWAGSPSSDWMPWAKKSLERKGFEVSVPEMPETDNPKITPWVNKLNETIGKVQNDDILIGHSIGCLTILRYLETLKDNEKVSKVILVAPWQFLTLDENENPEIAKPWIETPIDYEKIKSKADKIIAIFSDNDPWVPFEKNTEFFKEKLNPEIITKQGMGHFTAEEGSAELPFLLELLI
jgi:hypothetical protein